MILLKIVKTQTYVHPIGYVLFLARPIILLLKMAVLSKALQTDGFESFWYSLYTWWLHLPHILSGSVQSTKGSYT